MSLPWRTISCYICMLLHVTRIDMFGHRLLFVIYNFVRIKTMSLLSCYYTGRLNAQIQYFDMHPIFMFHLFTFAYKCVPVKKYVLADVPEY